MIKATVRYNGEHFAALQNVTRRVDILTILGYCIHIIGILVIAGLLADIYHFLDSPYASVRSKGTKWFVIYIAILIFLVYQLIMLPIKQKRKRTKLENTPPVDDVRYFTVDETYFRMEIVGGARRSVTTLDYEGIPKAIEFGDYFFIFVDAEHAAIIGRHELTEGAPLEFTKLLESKLGEKFTRRLGEVRS